MDNAKKSELQAIQQLSVAIKQLICTSESLSREKEKTFRRVEERGGGGGGANHSATCDDDREDSRLNKSFKRTRDGEMLERKGTVTSNVATGGCATDTAGGDQVGWNVSHLHNAPREAMLQIACDFFTACSARLIKMGEKQKIADLLDAKSIMVRLLISNYLQ